MTAEQQELITKAQDSLRAAILLVNKEFYDFAVSRAYYAMFYIAQAFLLGEGLAFSKHSAVISAFGKHFAKTKKLPEKFHRYLLDGIDSRNVGDYSLGPGLSKEEADQQIKRAQEFLDLVETYLI